MSIFSRFIKHKESLPFELFVGMRYTRAKRRNHFISFISLTSMVGIGLGVAALIVVLSVMNGFQEELRSRILGVASHLQITGANSVLADWQTVSSKVQTAKHVTGTAPYIMAQGMLSNGQAVQGAIVRGVLPSEEGKVSDLAEHMRAGQLADLKADEFGIVLGAELAQSLGVVLGDKVVLMAPQGQFTPTGVVPRIKQFTVVGLFQIGMYEYDAGLALINIDDAAKLYRMGDNVSGVRLKLDDLFLAPKISTDLAVVLSNETQALFLTDWTQEHANFFRAIQMEKRVMFIILALIVAVAAFNIVSTLVMAVTDKRADIAIMRTMGASRANITRIFFACGSLIGIAGTFIGVFFGLIIAVNVDNIRIWVEHISGGKILAEQLYFISTLPAEIDPAQVGTIIIMSLTLSFLATIYPARKAARLDPAEALRYE